MTIQNEMTTVSKNVLKKNLAKKHCEIIIPSEEFILKILYILLGL